MLLLFGFTHLCSTHEKLDTQTKFQQKSRTDKLEEQSVGTITKLDIREVV